MKSGVRALGVAESYTGVAADGDAGPGSVVDAREETTGTGRRPRSVLCGAVVRADRVVDGFALGSCTVGGTDATASVRTLFSTLGREDVRYLFVSGIAPAWFNVLDLPRLAGAVDRPALSVSFEPSEGLESALGDQFDGEALERRLSTYRAQPPRRAVEVNGETVYVRAAGLPADEAAAVVRGFTPEGGRPEPLRVARLTARAARRWADE